MKIRPTALSIGLLATLLFFATMPAARALVTVASNITRPNGNISSQNHGAWGQGSAFAFRTGPTETRLHTVSLKFKQILLADVRVKLWSDGAGVPGTVLEDLGLINVPGNEIDLQASRTSTLKPLLAPNTRYWLAATFESGAGSIQLHRTDFEGLSDDGEVLRELAETTNGGASWSPVATSVMGAISVIGIPPTPVANTNDSGPGSLREAILGAPPGGAVTFDAALAGQTINLLSPLTLERSVIVDASALPGGLLLSGRNLNRVMFVSGRPVTLRHLTLSNGRANNFAEGAGAAIYNTGDVILEDCTVSNNDGSGASGGGILSLFSSSAIFRRCTFANNTAYQGGAINALAPSAGLTLENCTLSGNTASDQGGAIHTSGTLELNHVTLVENSSIRGGGIYQGSGSFTLTNSIIARNTVSGAGSGGPDLYRSGGTINPTGLNQLSSLSQSGLVTGPSVLFPDTPAFAALGSYGGPTQTQPPFSLFVRDRAINSSLATDQRGIPRSIAWKNDFSSSLQSATVLKEGFPLDSLTGTLDAGSFRLTPAVGFQSASLTLPDLGPVPAFHAAFSIVYPADNSGGSNGAVSFSLGAPPVASAGANGTNPGLALSFSTLDGRVTVALNGTLIHSQSAFFTPALAGTNYFTITLDSTGFLRVTNNNNGSNFFVASGFQSIAGDRFTFGGQNFSRARELRIDDVQIHVGNGGVPDLGAVEFQPTIQVSTAADENNGLADGHVSLREALLFGAPGEAGLVTFLPALNGATNTLSGTELAPSRNVLVDASSLPRGFTVDANGQSRVLHIPSTLTCTFDSLRFTGGRSADGGRDQNNILRDGQNGGGILNQGVLTLRNASVIGNRTGDQTASGGYSGYGGGIASSGTLTLENTVLAGNRTGSPTQTGGSPGPGGGLYNDAGTAILSGCTLSGNQTASRADIPIPAAGGAVCNTGSLTLSRTTVFGNVGGGSGSTLQHFGTSPVLLDHCTIANNPPVDPFNDAVGLYFDNGALTLRNTVIAGNVPANSQEFQKSNGAFIRGGVNFLGNLIGTGLVADPSLLTGDAKLAPLGDYGGRTPTCPPLPGSPLLDVTATAHLADQRGFARYAPGVTFTPWSNDFESSLSGATPLGVGVLNAGSFRFTTATTEQYGSLVLPYQGPVTAFAASFDLYFSDPVGNDPADGFTFALGPAPTSAFGEGGPAEGLMVSFITYPLAGNTRDILVRRLPGPGTFHEADQIINLGTDVNRWVPVTVVLNTLGQLSVTWDGRPAVSNLATGYVPVDGHVFSLGARTGGEFSEHRVDNLVITAPVDIGAAEYQGRADLARYWPMDWDGDGEGYGVEQALGRDPLVADATHPSRPALTTPGGVPTLTFGLNPDANATTHWILERATSLTPPNFEEIFRYAGPTGLVTAESGNGFAIVPTAIQVQDANPPAPLGFYRITAELAP